MNSLKIAQLNVRSLLAGFDEYKKIICQYDIFGITESWLNNDVLNDIINIENFTIVRRDRSTRGGGIVIYIKNNIKYSILNIATKNCFEQIWLNIHLHPFSLAVGVFYRPPSYNLLNSLEVFEEAISAVLPVTNYIICLGDSNVDLLKVNNATIKFTDMLNVYGLQQLINEPTRLTRTTSTLIDHIITSDASNIKYSGVVHVHGITDHCLIHCDVSFAIPKVPPKFLIVRDFKNIDNVMFRTHLENLPWEIIYQINGIDDKLHFLNETILWLFDAHAPNKKIRVSKPKAPWLTDNIKLMMKFRDEALKRFKLTKNKVHWDYYKNLRNFTTGAIIREKKAYLQFILLNSNKKNLWKQLKNLDIYNKPIKTIPVNLLDPNKINDEFLNSINSNFQADPTILQFYNNNVIDGLANEFKFSVVTEDQISKTIDKISSKSVGVDGISITMINMCCPFLIPFISHIINFCLRESVFPSQWKTAIIHPLPKVSSPLDFKDLRPISILPVISKILEKCIDAQLRAHLTSNAILSDMQSGFRPGYSCSTALLHITDDIIAAADQDKLTVMVLLDFSKAFDTISHDILLAILHYIGLTADAIQLLANFISNRFQMVAINDDKSLSKPVNCGVPQGSILGPLLYTIYTATFKKAIRRCNYHFYADDTQLYFSFKPDNILTANDIVNADLSNLIEIANNHSLHINPLKSVVMLFGKSKARNNALPHVNIKINGISIPLKDCSRNLGLHIDQNLRFKLHITRALQKAYCNLKMLYNSSKILNVKLKTMLTESLVLSHFNYCDTVLGPCLDSIEIRRIQTVQNACIRFIFGIRKRDHVSHKLKELKWLKMEDRRFLHAACQFHRIILTKSPPYLCRKIRFRTDIHNINIRQKKLITIPPHKSTLFQRSFSYNIAKIYNKLPSEIKNCSSLQFKRKLKKLLLNLLL